MTQDNERDYEIFKAAKELPSAEREPFLDRECGDDDELRAEVESLLEQHFTSAQTVQPNEQSSDTTLDYQPGDMIGSFKILNVLGEGGMGIVYLAEQSKPVKRRVALKVIKAGMDTKQVVARFEAERQALAIMNHPGIAQVYEAGVTEHGRPYFVMEHVKGMPITDACDELTLTTKQRLELMAKVCDAVQHAHSKMIIHRDLKPNNILVSIDGKKLEPKIIDFGVAKAMTYQLTEKTLVTQVGHFVGTPAYMSPEQADLKTLDIDAKTDVYALGVVLYEVLTGMPPFDPQTLREAGLEKMREIIRTQLPPKPSTQLSSISDTDDATKIANARQTQIAALAGLLRKELEWIPLKALKKQRSERYDSAKSMGDDIRRYLAGEALEAGPESTLYRFKKTLRKHKGPFIATAIIFLVLVGGIITTTAQTIRANKLATIAKQQRASALQQSYYGNIRATSVAVDSEETATAFKHIDIALDALNQLEVDLPFEWKYLHAKADDSLAVFKGNDGSVESVAYSPDGLRIAGAGDKTVRIWDATSGEELAVLKGHEGFVRSVAFSPDGLRIAGAGDKTVRIWDASSGEELAVLKGHEASVWSVAFSPDGSRIVSGDSSSLVHIWDGQSGKILTTIKTPSSIRATAFSPDGTRIASSGLGGLPTIWDVNSGEVLVAPMTNTWVKSIAFSPDGLRIVSGGMDDTVRIWDATNGEQLTVLNGHKHEVTSVAFSPDGLRIVSGSMDNTVRIWDATNGEQLAVLNGHEDIVYSVAFSPDGTRIVSGGNDTARLWDEGISVKLGILGEEPEEITIIRGSQSVAPALATEASSSSPPTAEISTQDGVETVNASLIKWPGRLPVQGGSVILAFDEVSIYETFGFIAQTTGKVVIPVNASSLRAKKITLNTEKPIDRGMALDFLFQAFRLNQVDVIEHEDTIIIGPLDSFISNIDEISVPSVNKSRNFSRRLFGGKIAISPDGLHVVAGGGSDGSLRMWDTISGEELASFERLYSGVDSVAFSPDGLHLAIGGFKNIYVWDAVRLEELYVLEADYGVRSLAFSPDGLLLAAGTLGSGVHIWDWTSGKKLHVLAGGEELAWRSVESLSFSPDGSQVAAGHMAGFCIWDVASGKKLDIIKEPYNMEMTVAFSPDGLRIVSGDDRTLRIRDTTNGEILATIKVSEDINSIIFSPNGKRIVLGCGKTLRILNATNGEELVALKGHEDNVASVAFSPDGSRIISADRDTVRIWDTKSRSVVANERRLAKDLLDNLSPIVDSWIDKTDGNSELVLAMLDREIKNRPREEANTLRNLVLKKLVEQRQANQMKDNQ